MIVQKVFHQSELTGKWGVMKNTLEYLKIEGIFTNAFYILGHFLINFNLN